MAGQLAVHCSVVWIIRLRCSAILTVQCFALWNLRGPPESRLQILAFGTLGLLVFWLRAFGTQTVAHRIDWHRGIPWTSQIKGWEWCALRLGLHCIALQYIVSAMQCAVALRLRIPNGCPLQSCSAPPSTTSQQQPAKTLQYLRPTLFSPHTNHLFSSFLFSHHIFSSCTSTSSSPPHFLLFWWYLFLQRLCSYTFLLLFFNVPNIPFVPFFSVEVLVEIIEGLVFFSY